MRVYQVALLATAICLAATASVTATTDISTMTAPETSAWGHALSAEEAEGTSKRFLRAEKITKEEEEESEEEERVLPGTELAAKLAPKLEKALSNKELATTTMHKERWQFALWFIQGKSPSYVAENVLKVNPLSSTGRAVAMYHRYVKYFQNYKFTGIKFHFNPKN